MSLYSGVSKSTHVPKTMTRPANASERVVWVSPNPDDLLEVVNIADGTTYLINKSSRGLIGSNKRVSVVEKTERGFLNRVFIGKYLDLAYRLVIPRKTIEWDDDIPCLKDHSEAISKYIVGGTAIRLYDKGFLLYSVIRIDDDGVWGTHKKVI